MAEEYYKLYGKQTEKIAGVLDGNERSIKDLCNLINASGITNETIIYTKIDIEEYKITQKNLAEKIVKDMTPKHMTMQLGEERKN